MIANLPNVECLIRTFGINNNILLCKNVRFENYLSYKDALAILKSVLGRNNNS